MAHIGYDAIGGQSLQTIPENSMMANWVSSIVMKTDAHTLTAYVYGRKNAEGSAQFVVSIYEKGATAAESTLLGYATGTMNSQTPKWWSVPLELSLSAGKEYLVALQFEGVDGYMFGWTSAMPLHTLWVIDIGSTPPSTLTGGYPTSKEYSCYVTYEEEPPSTRLLACVEPSTRLTSGRETTYEEGHPPGDALDGNPNTYWKPDTLTDKALWFDLGKAVSVDAAVFWLRNYNETYGSPKSWRLSHSNDDNDYTALDEKLFEDERSDGSPIVVDELSSPVSARYWKLELLHFDEHPPGPKSEVGAVWFTNRYGMRYRSQLPDSDSSRFSSVVYGSMSGNEYPEETYRGRDDAMTRKFLIASPSEWENLRDAHRVSKGNCRPVVVKLDTGGDWKICTFDGGLFKLQNEFELYRPTVRLREVGFKRVPFNKRLLPPFASTVAYWRFNEDLLDESGHGNHLTVYPAQGQPPLVEPAWIPGVCEPGRTALNFPDGSKVYGVYIPAAQAGDLDMGMSDFTIEVIFLQECDGLSTLLVKRGSSGPAWRILSSDRGIRVGLGDDAAHNVVQDAYVGAGVGEWRYFAVAVDRTANTLNIYLNGEVVQEDVNISALTGNITKADRNFHIQPIKDDLAVDEVCISKKALSAALIAERAAGFMDYGKWRM